MKNEVEWIDINEKMPIEDVCVLVNIVNEKGSEIKNEIMILFRIKDKWYNSYKGEEFKQGPKTITHWMLVPDHSVTLKSPSIH